MDKNPYVEDNRVTDVFTADYARKTLIVPEGNRIFGVKGDHYGRCFRCKLLNYPDTTVRFTNETAVAYLQFENAAGETGSVKLKIEETTNRNDANKEGEAAVLLSATIPNSLTKEAGTARLQLCGSYQAANGTWIHWHLAPVEVEIADFFDNEEIAKSDPKYSLVEQAHTEINALSTKVADLQKALQTSLEDIKSALDDLDESNLPDSVLTQVTANRASIQALQQKVTALENAGVDIDSLSETFATLEAVAADYETKVHASETYMRKDDSDYANVVSRLKTVENSYLSKGDVDNSYVKKSETDVFANKWRSLGEGFVNVNLETCQSNCAKFGFQVDHVAVLTGDPERQFADELPEVTMFTFAGNTACAFTFKFLGGSYGLSELNNEITFEASGNTTVTIERIPAGSITGKVTIDSATGSKSAFLTGNLSQVTEIQVIGAAHAGVCGVVTMVSR